MGNNNISTYTTIPEQALYDWVGHRGGDMLDIGCRSSSLLSFWSPDTYLGVDPDKDLIGKAVEKYGGKSDNREFVHASYDNPWDPENHKFAWSNTTQKFDTVFCFYQLMESTVNWNMFLANVSCLLKEDGIFVGVITPRMWSIDTRIHVPKWFKEFDIIDLGHVYGIKGVL